MGQHAVMLLEGCEKGIGEEVCKIVAMLSVKQVFMIPRSRRFEAIRLHKQFTTQEGDLLAMINVFDGFVKNKQNQRFAHKYYLNGQGLEQAMIIYKRLMGTLKGLKLKVESTVEPDTEMLLDVIASGYFLNSAYLHHDGFYYTCREKTKLKIHQDSCVFGLNPPPKVITFGDTTEASYQEAVDVQNRVLNQDGSKNERLFLVKEVTSYPDFS